MQRHILTAVIVLVLGGCVSHRRIAPLAGFYVAPARGDMIEIRRDGSLYWSPLSKTKNDMAYVGTVTPDSNSPHRFTVTVPSASYFWDITIDAADDFTELHVDWGRKVNPNAMDRASDYQRQR